LKTPRAVENIRVFCSQIVCWRSEFALLMAPRTPDPDSWPGALDLIWHDIDFHRRVLVFLAESSFTLRKLKLAPLSHPLPSLKSRFQILLKSLGRERWSIRIIASLPPPILPPLQRTIESTTSHHDLVFNLKISDIPKYFPHLLRAGSRPQSAANDWLLHLLILRF
jgi:hypothetical protein